MEEFTGFLLYSRDFPEEWINLRHAGIWGGVLLGIIIGIKLNAKSYFFVIAAFLLFFLASYASVSFDEKYLVTFKETGVTHPEPLFECLELTRYLESIPVEKQENPSDWWKYVYSPECKNSSNSTIFLSSFLAFLRMLFLITIIILTLKIIVIKIRQVNNSNTLSKMPDQSLFNGADLKIEKEEDKELNSEMEISSTVQNKEPDKEFDNTQPVPDQYKEIEEYEDLLKKICTSINYNNEIRKGWDGEIFLEFVIKTTKESKLFIGGIGIKNKVSIQLKTFYNIKTKGIGCDSVKSILYWVAEFKDIPLQKVLAEFVIYYESKTKKSPEQRKNFYKGIEDAIDKLKNEVGR